MLLDVMMPLMNGFEVCRHIKSDPQTNGIIIILLTGMAENADKAHCKEVGANGYFPKPFAPVDLLKKVEEVLGFG